MADIAASDVTYTLQGKTARSTAADPSYRAIFKIDFGNGSLTYPTGGIPLTKAKLGCPNKLESFEISDAGSAAGYIIKYDYANEKLKIYQAGGSFDHTHDLLIKGGQAAASTAAVAWYATDILGKEAATDKTIAGSAAATKGGVQSATVSSTVAELTGGSSAVTATTIYARVSGF